MKAVVYEAYGLPEVLRFTELERLAPWDDEVLVRVHGCPVTVGTRSGDGTS